MTQKEILDKLYNEHGYDYCGSEHKNSHIFTKKNETYDMCRIIVEDHMDEDKDPDYYIYTEVYDGEYDYYGKPVSIPYAMTYKELYLIKEFIESLNKAKPQENEEV